jgi:hypothetical protein
VVDSAALVHQGSGSPRVEGRDQRYVTELPVEQHEVRNVDSAMELVRCGVWDLRERVVEVIDSQWITSKRLALWSTRSGIRT